MAGASSKTHYNHYSAVIFSNLYSSNVKKQPPPSKQTNKKQTNKQTKIKTKYKYKPKVKWNKIKNN
jgi:hypothetical protein